MTDRDDDESELVTGARWHALRAGDLLEGAERYEAQLEAMAPEDRLAAAVAGGIAKANADLRWTVELGIAHALVAIALEATSGGLEP